MYGSEALANGSLHSNTDNKRKGFIKGGRVGRIVKPITTKSPQTIDNNSAQPSKEEKGANPTSDITQKASKDNIDNAFSHDNTRVHTIPNDTLVDSPTLAPNVRADNIADSKMHISHSTTECPITPMHAGDNAKTDTAISSNATNLEISGVSNQADISKQMEQDNTPSNTEHNKNSHSAESKNTLDSASMLEYKIGSISNLATANNVESNSKQNVAITPPKDSHNEGSKPMPATLRITIENRNFSINLNLLSPPSRRKILSTFHKDSYRLGELLNMLVVCLRDQAIAESKLISLLDNLHDNIK